MRTDESDTDVVLTTCHQDEPLREAIRYFAFAAFVAEDYIAKCRDWIAVSVNNTEWQRAIRS